MCQKLVVLNQILILIFTEICIVLKPFSLLFIKQMHALNRSYLFGQFYNLHLYLDTVGLKLRPFRARLFKQH